MVEKLFLKVSSVRGIATQKEVNETHLLFTSRSELKDV